ncbi:hypothetical protein [Streptomyces parvulus]|uniref:hypothetical protein n=1 Tax=Streptomyces parvulus TaxID=146923 RepID=UPI0033DE5861
MAADSRAATAIRAVSALLAGRRRALDAQRRHPSGRAVERAGGYGTLLLVPVALYVWLAAYASTTRGNAGGRQPWPT